MNDLNKKLKECIISRGWLKIRRSFTDKKEIYEKLLAYYRDNIVIDLNPEEIQDARKIIFLGCNEMSLALKMPRSTEVDNNDNIGLSMLAILPA